MGLFMSAGTLRTLNSSKEGFSSVYIVIMLSSLLYLIFCVTEASTGYAASAISEEVAALACRSVMSEYDRDLYSRYGVFATALEDEEMAALAKHYIDESIKGEGLVTRMRSGRVSASSIGYEGTQLQPFKTQISQLGTLCAARCAAKESDIFAGLAAAAGVCDDTFRYELSRIKNEPPPEPPDEGSDEAEGWEDPTAEGRRQAGRLLGDYDRAVSAGGSPSLLLSMGHRDISGDALAIDEYILCQCGRITKTASGPALALEVEYIMYGYPDDSANQSCVRSSLFWTRMPINTAKILQDPRRMAEIEAIAAAFTAVPYPVAFAAVLATYAAADSNGDVSRILAGETVPLIDSLPAFGDYDDYLRLLLLAVPEEKKLARLMDVMQRNIDGLSFRDLSFGFTLEAEFEKRCYAPGFEPRKRIVTQTHVYK